MELNKDFLVEVMLLSSPVQFSGRKYMKKMFGSFFQNII